MKKRNICFARLEHLHDYLPGSHLGIDYELTNVVSGPIAHATWDKLVDAVKWYADELSRSGYYQEDPEEM